VTDERQSPRPPRYIRTTRLEAFSDGVFAIAITLLVLDLAIPRQGSAFHRVVEGWPFYLAYTVSFLTIGAAWLAHSAITDRLERADSILLRLTLLMLLTVSFLPFPTRLVAESLHNASDERVFVAMYGLTLLCVRVLLYAIDAYARRERLYAPNETEEFETERQTVLPALIGYLVAVGVGCLLPRVAVALYCAIAVYLIVPFKELARLLFHRP
jgi:uncharacterized membrane protein